MNTSEDKLHNLEFAAHYQRRQAYWHALAVNAFEIGNLYDAELCQQNAAEAYAVACEFMGELV